MKKPISMTTYPLHYTKNVYVHEDGTVRNSQGVLLGQYAGCELDNFESELTNCTFYPPSLDGFGFHVVYLFLKKEGKYYEVNWSGEYKEVSFFQLSLSRLTARKRWAQGKLKFLLLIPYLFRKSEFVISVEAR